MPHIEEVGENSLRSRKSRTSKRNRILNITSFVRSFVRSVGIQAPGPPPPETSGPSPRGTAATTVATSGGKGGKGEAATKVAVDIETAASTVPGKPVAMTAPPPPKDASETCDCGARKM